MVMMKTIIYMAKKWHANLHCLRTMRLVSTDSNINPVPAEWRNSLDKAIARLENEIPAMSCEYGSEPVVILSDRGHECSSSSSVIP